MDKSLAKLLLLRRLEGIKAFEGFQGVRVCDRTIRISLTLTSIDE